MASLPSTPWVECPSITLDGRLPIQKRFQNLPPAAVDQARRLLVSIRSTIPPAARRLAQIVRVRTLNRFHAEFEMLASLVGADWRDILLANISYDLVVGSFGCSTVALATKDGPVVARNMDWWPEDLLAQASWLIRNEGPRGIQFANAGWPGAVGVVTGMSGRGFAVVLNAVTGPEGRDLWGYPVLLHLRRILEDADGFDAALEALSQTRLTTPCLITLVGSHNTQRVVIERSPKRFALRRPEGDAALVCTNDYRALFGNAAAGQNSAGENELFRSACGRYDSLCRHFRGDTSGRTVTDEELLYALTDAEVMSGITAQHVLMRPKEGAIRMFVPRYLTARK